MTMFLLPNGSRNSSELFAYTRKGFCRQSFPLHSCDNSHDNRIAIQNFTEKSSQ